MKRDAVKEKYRENMEQRDGVKERLVTNRERERERL